MQGMKEHEPQGSAHHDSDNDLTELLYELEAALKVATAQRVAAEEIAEAHKQRAESAERALRLLEAGPNPAQQDGSLNTSTPAHEQGQRWWNKLFKG